MSQKQAKKLRKELRRQQQIRPKASNFTLSIPQAWLNNPAISSIWVAAFSVLYASKEELELGEKMVAFSDVQIAIRYRYVTL